MRAQRSRSCLAILAVLCAAPLTAQEHAHHAGEKLGRVAFPITCDAEARQRFERAVAMLHSFWFTEAEKTFQEAAQADPGCAMAHWGVAMVRLGNPLAGAPTPENAQAGLGAAERAAKVGARSEREQAYIAAVGTLWRDQDRLQHRARMQAYEQAMAGIRERWSDDTEASIFYALAVIANAPPADLEFKRQKHAAELLTPLFRAQPDHPGLAHYIIHAFDSPPLASLGLDAARRYADIAPSAPHALHMPSHIFTRLGLWDESIATNRRSADAEPNPSAAVHPMDYMVYAYLQQGRDESAGKVVRTAVQLPDRFYGGTLGYNFVAMPARYALERGRWGEAAALKVPTGAAPWVEAVPRFARAVGAGRSGQAAAAGTEVEALAGLRDRLKQQGDPYWATIVGAQHLAASAWVAFAQGRKDEALRLAGQAADLEETVEKHPVTPGPILPARELLGDLLLELGRHAEARAAYEKTLTREPNRARSLFGAARTAELAGDAAAAERRYGQLVELMSRAEAERPELAAARAFLAERKPGSAGAEIEATSLLGPPLPRPALAADAAARLEGDIAAARAEHEQHPDDADRLIWLGRRLAYAGRYREAIDVFSRGVEKHPADARFLRHRGHRHITTRQLERAVADLERAAALVRGEPDEVEPDGQPNRYNVPTSTLQSNIWYHLGLAHYLRGDFARALDAYSAAMKVSTNADMMVATADWLYMTLRRLGREREAAAVLEPITADLKILENDAYHRRLLMYKGLVRPEEVLNARSEDAITLATQGYGVANWYLYNGDAERARALFRQILALPNWAPFGFIAAEAELARMEGRKGS